MALDHAAVPLLLNLLDEEPAATSACSDCGHLHGDQDLSPREWAPLHAADLLTELREPAAIGAMLKILERTSVDAPIHDKVVECLPDFGEAALEPTLAALARTKVDSDTAESLCCVLSALGLRDERILQALMNLMKVHPRAAAMYLADYGDPAAGPAVLGVIATFELDVDDSFGRTELVDLLDAYAALGGELPANVKTRVDGWLAESS